MESDLKNYWNGDSNGLKWTQEDSRWTQDGLKMDSKGGVESTQVQTGKIVDYRFWKGQKDRCNNNEKKV